jgi:alpha-tubulin suppressor-like RCC1 family protein
MTLVARWSRSRHAGAMVLLGAFLASCTRDTSPTPSERISHLSAAINASPTIGDFALYAQRSITIGAQDQIFSGDIGVAQLAVASFGSQLIVDPQAQTFSANLIAPSVTLGSQCQVGSIQTSTLTNNGAQSLGTVATYPASLMPPPPVAGNPATSSSNLTIAADARTTLSPGAYGALTIGNQAQVTLAAGSYSFSSVAIGNQVRITTTSPGVTWLVSGTFAVGNQVQINRTGGVAAGALTILVGGSDAASGTPPAASIGQETQMNALLAVPHGTLAVSLQAQLTGAFTAFDIKLANQVQVTYQSGFSASTPAQQGSQQLSGYISPAIAAAPLVGPVPPSTLIALAISLPVQVPTSFPALPDFVRQVSDPTNAIYRQFITPAQYAGYYQPSAASYAALTAFAQAYGLTIARSYADNEMLDVTGTAAQIGQMIYGNLNLYARADGSQFFAPDREPSLALATPVLSVAGLKNYNLPIAAGSGTGPAGGDLWGNDFRNAYLASCASKFDGTGQAIGLIEFQSFNPSDIQAYINQAGLASLSIYTATLTAPFSGSIPTNLNEAPVDIEVAHSMAPGAQIVVYQAYASSISYGPFGGINFADDMLHDMAHTPSGLPRTYQNSSSYFGFDTDSDTEQELAAIASMGGSFFEASGDGGAYTGNPIDIHAYDNVTLVGGTNVTSFGGGNPPAEVAWAGSGGGFFGPLPLIPGIGIPSYQTGFVNSANLASASYRNFPDVSIAAQNIADIYTLAGASTPTDNSGSGTSASAPLWAAFTALANQAAQAAGVQTVGFPNPVLYDIAAGGLYGTCFNDVVGGSNPQNPAGAGAGLDDQTSFPPPNGFPAVAGYDLATGLGSPTCTLITQLASPTPLIPVPVPPATPTPPGFFAGIGANDTCGLLDGAVECWGQNNNGEDGNGSTNSQLSPGCVTGLTGLAEATQVVEGSMHSCVLFSDGGVWCWGDNSYGQLGSATLSGSSTPVNLDGVYTADQGTPATQLSAGGGVTCALYFDGSVWCWGQNDQGQLGNGSTNSGPNPNPTQVQSLPPASQIAVSTSGTFACALLQNGNVECWGANTYGQLGDPGVGLSSSTPQPVTPFGSASQIAAGDTHVCAVVPVGQSGAGLWCWGDNSESQLGEGSINTGAVPTRQANPTLATQVSGCSSACPPPVQVTAVTCGNDFTCVLIAGGTVECWGDDSVGEIGNGTQSSVPISSPTAVSGLSGVNGIVAGSEGVCAQGPSGGISCWGAGPVGNGASGVASSPSQVTFTTTCP